MRRKAKRRIVLYPDSCECTARERASCAHACKPLYGGDVRKRAEHRKHIKENRGGRDDRPAGTPGATRMKPCVCDLPIGDRTECQHKPGCPVPGIKQALEYKGPPGVKLMQGHSPAVLAGVFHDAKVKPGMMIAGSLMGSDEYATRGVDDFPDGGRPVPWQFQIAEYELRESRKGNGQWGIYCRDYNVRLATFAPNSFALRDALSRGFDAAHVLKKKRADEFKVSRMPVGKQIKHRQAAERAMNNGWFTCQCGQWINRKLAPCSVCR